jgi:hypothetical protein
LRRPITLKGEEIPALREIEMSSEESIVPRKGESFPFINVTPGSATESTHSRFLIRSHVGSWVWQQTKQNSEALDTDKVDDALDTDKVDALDTDKVDDGHTQDVNRSTHRADADGNHTEFEATQSTSLAASLTIGCQTPDMATGQRSSRGRDDNGPDLPDEPKLSASDPRRSLYSIDYISVDTLDPFQTYPSKFPPAVFNWCIKYCLCYSVLCHGPAY